MTLAYYLKIQAYKFINTNIGKYLLKLLSNFVYARNLKKGGQKNKFPFIIAITIDTESGYVNKNEYRVWQKHKPGAYIGFYKGIEAWRKLFNKYNIKATFFLSTNCFGAKGFEYKKILQQLKLLLKEGSEIGLHLHPDSDLALQKALNRKFHATSAKFYNEKEISELVFTGKNIIKNKLGINTTSFRWGNWALNTSAVKALQKNGFKIESSAVPGIKGHANDTMEYDWSKVNEHYPWRLSTLDYKNIQHQNSKVLEMPIATFSFFGLSLRADPVNSELLNACFEHYYKNADRSKAPFIFIVISHSSEAIYEDGTKTKVVDIMEEFIMHAKQYNKVKFLTLKEAYGLLNKYC